MLTMNEALEKLDEASVSINDVQKLVALGQYSLANQLQRHVQAMHDQVRITIRKAIEDEKKK